MKCKLIDISFTMDGKARLTIELAKNEAISLWDKLHDQVCDLLLKIWREPRSLNANAYMWELLNEIGNVLSISKEEVYFVMLKKYGQGGLASILEKDVSAFVRTYKYHEEAGESTLNGKLFKHFRFWIGSSEYDTKEMSILLEGVVDEAKEQGIDTRTPDEIKKMEAIWNQ